MENIELNFTLTVAEANGVLGALGKLPYEQAAGLIAKLQQQAAPQIQAAQAAGQLEPAQEAA